MKDRAPSAPMFAGRPGWFANAISTVALAVVVLGGPTRSAHAQSPAAGTAQPAGAAAAGASEGAAAPLGPTGGRVGGGEVQIVGGNVASARERALTAALKQAVDQAISSMTPDPHVAQPKTVVQVLGRARGFVRRYRTLEEGERSRGLYGVRIEAEIDEGALLRAFDKGSPAAPSGNVAAAASTPSYLMISAGAPDATDAAARAFTAAGARVQVGAGSESSEPAKAVEAAARAGLGTVAFVSGNATAEGKVRGPGTEAVTCSLSVRVVTAGAGLPVADENETARAFADRPEAARAACFQRAATAAVPRVVPAAAFRVTPDIRTIVLDAEVMQPAAVPALVKQVRALGSVSALEIRRVTATRAELWVRSRLAASALAAALARDTGAALVISDAAVTGDLVRLRARLRDPAPAPAPAPSPSSSSSSSASSSAVTSPSGALAAPASNPTSPGAP